MPFCKHVVSKVILVPCSVNLTVQTGFSRSRGGDNKQKMNAIIINVYRTYKGRNTTLLRMYSFFES